MSCLFRHGDVVGGLTIPMVPGGAGLLARREVAALGGSHVCGRVVAVAAGMLRYALPQASGVVLEVAQGEAGTGLWVSLPVSPDAQDEHV